MYINMPEKPLRNNIVLATKASSKIITHLYDFTMFSQFIVFYIVCLTLGALSVVLDKIFLHDKALDGFVKVFSIIANFGVQETGKSS